MKTRIILGLCVALLCTVAASADTRFTGAIDELWSNADNWNNGLPDQDDKVQVQGGKTCVLDYDAGTIKHLALEGGAQTHVRLIDGAQVSARDWSIIAYAGKPDEAHLLEVLGGVYNANARMFVGFLGRGQLIVDYSGVVNLNAQELGVGENTDGEGRVDLRGGSLNLLSGSALPLRFRAGANATASMDFSGGVMTQAYSPERLAYVNDHITDGTMTAYDGVGTVLVDVVDNNETIVVKGLHPLQPVPADGGAVTPGPVTLQWTVAPGTPVDVWVDTRPDFVTAQRIVEQKVATSITLQADPKTRYFWAVDRYLDGAAEPNLGPIFDFLVDNLPPVVTAPADITTWIDGNDVTVDLAGMVEDSDPTTTLWTVVSEPNEGTASIADAAALDTTVTLTETGTYVLQLDASDGEYTGTDTVTINVFEDSCQAAQSLAGYEPIPGDINNDCRVNDLDYALMQEHWLECNALDCSDADGL